MPDDWVKTTTLEIIAQIAQFTTALNTPGGIAASGLTAAELNALGALNATLSTDHTAQLAAQAAAKAAVDTTGASERAAVARLRQLGRAANSYGAMTDAFRNAAGITVRDTEPTPGDLPVVDDLAVIGRPTGNNFLDWGTPAGVAAGIVWEIEATTVAGGPWVLVGSTSRTDFLHEKSGAGVHRIYRVVAKRGDRRGEPGNEAAVYG